MKSAKNHDCLYFFLIHTVILASMIFTAYLSKTPHTHVSLNGKSCESSKIDVCKKPFSSSM